MARDPKSTYYDVGGIETTDFIEAKLTEEELIGYFKGQSMRYLSRSPFKHESQMRDLEKAANYTRWAFEAAEKMEKEREALLLKAVAFDPDQIHRVITESLFQDGLGMPSADELRELVEKTGRDILETLEAHRARSEPAEETSETGVAYPHPLNHPGMDGLGERN